MIVKKFHAALSALGAWRARLRQDGEAGLR